MAADPSFVTPPALSPGDVRESEIRLDNQNSTSSGDDVAIIAPSSGSAASAPGVMELGLRRLREEFNLNPVVYDTAERDGEYLAAHPEARAADVHEAFRDPDIKGVIATIGGDDQLRVLKHLDPDVLRDNPTRFYGMSDNTNLTLYLWNLGIVSFYGGQLMNQIATPGSLPEYTKRNLERAFFADSLGRIEPADEWTDEVIEWTNPDYETTQPTFERGEGWDWHDPSDVTGRVWGGCLEIVHWQLAAGRYLPDPAALEGQVLAVETSEEMPSAVDVGRMLMCMGERGLLSRFDAVLVARPQTQNRFEKPGDEEREQFRRDQREAILGQLDRYNPDATVVFDLDFGHTNPNVPIPIGGRVELDGDERTVTFP